MPTPNLQSPISNLPLFRLAWRRLRRRPLQYILLIVGVAIGVAMMVSIDLANGSAQRAFQLSTDAIAGKTTHRIVGGPTGFDEEIYRRLETGDWRLDQSPVSSLQSPLAAPIVEDYLTVPELNERVMRLVGIDPFAEPPFRDYFAAQNSGEGNGIEGLVAFLTVPNSVILAQDVADEAGLALGDTITLNHSGQRTPAQIVGLLQPTDDVSRRALSGIVFTDIASAQEILGMTGKLSRIDLIVNDEATLAALTAVLPPGLRLETAAARSNAIRQMTAAFELNLSALSLLALVVGMFLIYNTVTFSVVQRRPLFGILRCLGVTSGQLFALILAETAVLGLVGSVLGLGLGILLGRGIVGLITQTINDFYFVVNVRGVDVPPFTLVKGLLVGLAAALFAALLPAWEAMRTAPNASLKRSNLESRTRQLLPWLALAWAVLTAVGVFLLWVRGNLIITFGGLFAVLIGAALLTPPLTVLLVRAVTPITQALLGVLGRMAPRDIVRSLSRTSVAVAALMTAVSVVVGVSIMIGSFRTTVVQWLNQTLQADVYVSTPTLTANRTFGTLPPEVIAEFRAWPGVDRVVTARHVQVDAPDLGRPVEIIAVDGDVSNGNRPYAWVNGDQATLWPRLLAGEGVIISEALVLKENLPTPPPDVVLQTAVGPRALPVLAVFYDYASDQGTIMIGQDLYRELWQDQAIESMGIFLQPGAEVDQVVREMTAAVNGRQDVLIQSNQALRAGSLEIFDRTFAITAALRLLAIVVAFIGVLSALMSLQLERARELGVLRATGMTVRQLWGLTFLETGLMGGIAGLLAVPVGYVLAWILIYVINVRSFGWTLQMQLEPAYFLQGVIVAIIAALLAAIYPSLRLGGMVVATAVREE
ncbi:MAG: ABC transporter permease [Ardenticatenaceae bacterium]|nr:ABC transporter permease [Ardenticatenaceae bacterium]MCB8988687.1 ABC transporter permease [Ardenticatenaceae bacterium]